MGNNSYTSCIKCENDYILSGGICLKYCEIGENNKCLKCNEEPGRINQCSLCNNGYYLPELNKTQCEKCLLDGCMTCSGNLIENKCTKCENNLSAIYKNGTIISCIKENPSTPDRIDIIKNGKLIMLQKLNFLMELNITLQQHVQQIHHLIGGNHLLEVLNANYQFILIFQRFYQKGRIN